MTSPRPAYESIREIMGMDLKGALARLAELSMLQDGWLDGLGKAPTPIAITAARSILQSTVVYVSRPGIFPTPEGGVQLEYSHAEIEIHPDGRIETRADEGST